MNSRRALPRVWPWLLAALLVMSLFLGPCKPSYAATQWTVDNVYKAIATEAIGEGREGMEYVASALRNRRAAGLNIGCSGLHRRSVDTWLRSQPESSLAYAYHLAGRVVDGVDGFDWVHGATHFESTDFKSPDWVKDGSHKEVFRYGKHVFYKKVHHG